MSEQNNEALNKAVDPMGLLRDVAAGLNEACAMIGTDPEAAKSLLAQMVAAMDTTDGVGTINPDSNKSPIADDSKTVSISAPGVKKDEAPAEVELAKVDVPAEPVAEPVAEAPAAAAISPEVAALMQLVQKQSEALSKMAETVSELQKGQSLPDELTLPLGDLNAIVDNMPDSDLLNALNDGNLSKAFEAVGNDTQRLYAEVNDLAIKQLAVAGINVQRFGILNTMEPLFGEQPK